MSLITRMRIHDAVYWPPPTNAGLGNDTFIAPLPIRCRWDEVQELFTASGGEEVASNAIIYSPAIVTSTADLTPVADQTSLKTGGWIMRGTLADLDSSGDTDPKNQALAFEIRRYDKIDKIRGNETLPIAYI